MRTTIDLPDDRHAQAVAIATSVRTGLPVAHLGRTITTEDVWRLEDGDR